MESLVRDDNSIPATKAQLQITDHEDSIEQISSNLLLFSALVTICTRFISELVEFWG